MTTQPASIYCRIVAGEIPSNRVYEDDHAIAFLDLDPFKTGHTLVVPRAHVSDALADAAVLASIAPAIAATGTLLVEKLGASGMNVLSNVGEDAGQSVFHLHVHLVPRFAHRAGLRELLVRESGIDLDRVYRQLTE